MNTTQRVSEAAGLIMVAMIVSRVLGYVRDLLIYAFFGQNEITDAYNAAFSIPDFLYMLLVGGALSSAFIPVFSSYIALKKEEEAWEVASIISSVIMLLMVTGVIAGLIFTPELVHLLVPGFSPYATSLTIKLTRIMFFQAILMGLSGISMGILNSYRHFAAPAIGSVLYNLGIITVGVLLAPKLGIEAFSIGVVVGALLNFVVQIPSLLRCGLRYRLNFNIRHPGVTRICVLILPILLSLSVTQFNLFVNQNLASGLPAGSVAALRTAQRLIQLPIGIFAIAIGVASFPAMAGLAAQHKWREFRRTFSMSMRSIIFFNVPSAIGLIVLAVPIVRVLFEQGMFTPQATFQTAYALWFYSVGLVPYAALQVLNRVFYSLQDTITPALMAFVTVALNVFLNLELMPWLGHGGLALGYSLAGAFNVGCLLYLLSRRVKGIGGGEILVSLGKSLLASLVMAFAAVSVSSYVGAVLGTDAKIAQVLQVGLSVGAGVIAYALAAACLSMPEMAMVWETVSRRFRLRGRHF